MQRVFRWFLPALVTIVWVASIGIGGPFFGLLGDVQTQAPTDFLPASAESTRALVLQGAFTDDTAPPAIVVFARAAGIDAAAQRTLAERLAAAAAIEGVGATSPLIPSGERSAAGDPLALQAFVQVEGEAPEVVAGLRATFGDLPAGVEGYVTGPAGFIADLVESFGEIDGILLVVAVVAVFLILLVVYRSPFLPILVLLTSLAALSVSVVAVYAMALTGLITINGQAQGILFILVIGAATDYSLLMVSRYREALLEHRDVVVAIRRAWRGAFEPILASGGTVIAGVMCLLLSDLNSNKALGPIASVGIAVAMIAALTMLPAILTLFGRAAFLPFPPRFAAYGAAAAAKSNSVWANVAGLVGRWPRATWMVTASVLLVAAAFAPTFRADGVPQSAIVLGETESLLGQQVLGHYFAAGSGTPTSVIIGQEHAERAVAALAAVDGVASAVLRRAPFGPPAARPVLVAEGDGRSLVEVEVTLAFAADSAEAIAVVRSLRETIRRIDPLAVVGGPTATDLDTRTTARADLVVIIPAVLIVITLMLVVLLRSVLAPVLLVATTALSFLSTLGVSSLVFDHLLGFPGADPVVPLFGFVFLVALGIDYNIFLVSRVREEALTRGTRPAVLVGLRTTGGVITSAGIVLAATFAALAVIPLLFLVQLAFIVAFGVLLDALVVRSFLVPGLLYDLGRRSWWPSALSRRDPAVRDGAPVARIGAD
jgi:putative drug exporter of the RND superfamily